MSASVTFFNHAPRQPTLEIHYPLPEPNHLVEQLPFSLLPYQRRAGEYCWQVRPNLPAHGEWHFRINLGDNTYFAPYGMGSFAYYQTSLRQLWIQRGQLFDYEPPLAQSLSHVVKIPDFEGSLPRRPLYIYLPRGYYQHPDKRYPVIYMHDGQNCFDSWHGDSYAGTWRADRVADALIAQGKMQEVIIVGIGNSHDSRIAEYLWPTFTHYPRHSADGELHPIAGSADQTFRYYTEEVVPFIEQFYRVRRDRDGRATCGSSMGGLFSSYIAWEHPDFAAQHAALSPSFWITGKADDQFQHPHVIEKFRHEAARPIRLWLDSGTRTMEHWGDDGMFNTIAARDALLANGYQLGHNLGYYLAEGACHNEAAWAARLAYVWQFLFPLAG